MNGIYFEQIPETGFFMINDHEIEIILKDILYTYGYDFMHYARASLERRFHRLYALDRFPSFAEFRFKIKTDQDYFNRFLEEITVNVTEMFRDPSFYLVLRQEVLPAFTTYPFIRIWHAGCSTGEEVFSMAILLKEANLLHKSILYGTDINPLVIQKASGGIFPLSQMKIYSQNYMLSGGVHDFSSYYTAGNNKVIFDSSFKRHMVFSTHNLVSESSFNEFQLIICRNVLIYFDHNLQERVFRLFDESLATQGFIALGSKESLHTGKTRFRHIGKEKIWQKIV